MAALADRDARNVFFACPRRVDGPQRAEAMIRDSVIDWQELSRLYEHADALDPAGLAAWLAQLRSDKHRLLSQLERMLEARAQIASGTFLEALPKIDVAPQVLESEWAEGSRIGAYRLIRRVGSGGMAEIWLAERADGAFARQVAIKLLFNHPTRAQRETFVERFRRERDILASLHHPNIAGLHDAGVTPSGQPWLALEYVQGEPITAWCDARQLGVADRVRLFCQVLLAVEAAHASLVIHRDIKPSNILVNDAGDVKLLDFGIAKLLDASEGGRSATELTRQGGQPLTLQYASPEQLAGRPLTTSTDVFSLGLVLYELLGGTRPYDTSVLSAAQLERLLHDRLPCRLGKVSVGEDVAESRKTDVKTLRKLLSGDLEAIVGVALCPAPADRYPTVDAMRQDLARWRENRPIVAKPARTLYAMHKFWLRHRIAVSAGSAAVTALIAVSVVAMVLEQRATHESARATAARQFLFNMFREVDPENARGDVTATQVLKAGLDKALVDLADQPDLQAEVMGEIGSMQQAIGDYTRADMTFAKVVELRKARSSLAPLAAALIDWAFNTNQLGDANRASATVGQAEALFAQFDSDIELRSRLHYVKGLIADSLGDLNSAHRELNEALTLASKVFDRDDVRVIKLVRALAEVESEIGDHKGALQRIEDAAARASTKNLGAKTVFAIEYERANIQSNAGRFVGLASRLADLARECERLFGNREEKCVLVANLRAVVSLRIGDRVGAMEVLPVLLMSAENGASPRRQLLSLDSATRVLAANGELAAQPAIRDRLVAMSEGSSQTDEDRAYALIAVAESYLYEARPEETAAWAGKALELARTGPQKFPLVAARATLLQGLSSQARGRDAEALERIRAAADELGSVIGKGHPVVHVLRLNQVVSLARTKGRAEALTVLDAALPQIVDSFGANAPIVRRAEALKRSVITNDGIGSLALSSDFLT